MSTVRLQNIPEDFPGIVREGATAFHRMKAPCARYFGFRDEPQKPGRKRKVDEKLAIPVGKKLASDECPPILRRIDASSGATGAPLAPRASAHRLTPLFCVHRLVDISIMEREDKQQPLTDGALMEYIVHGEFAYKKSDINGTFGAWWVPLRKMVKELGKEVVEQKLEELDNEIKQIRAQTIDDANVDSSSDEE